MIQTLQIVDHAPRAIAFLYFGLPLINPMHVNLGIADIIPQLGHIQCNHIEVG